MRWSDAVKLWNERQKTVNPRHCYCQPRKGTPEHAEVKKIHAEGKAAAKATAKEATDKAAKEKEEKRLALTEKFRAAVAARRAAKEKEARRQELTAKLRAAVAARQASKSAEMSAAPAPTSEPKRFKIKPRQVKEAVKVAVNEVVEAPKSQRDKIIELLSAELYKPKSEPAAASPAIAHISEKDIKEFYGAGSYAKGQQLLAAHLEKGGYKYFIPYKRTRGLKGPGNPSGAVANPLTQPIPIKKFTKQRLYITDIPLPEGLRHKAKGDEHYLGLLPVVDTGIISGFVEVAGVLDGVKSGYGLQGYFAKSPTTRAPNDTDDRDPWAEEDRDFAARKALLDFS